MEHLRDSPIFAEPYFDIVDFISALEGGFQAFKGALT